MIPVVYNICTDFGNHTFEFPFVPICFTVNMIAEATQNQFVGNGLGGVLVTLLSKDAINGEALIGYTVELLETASGKGMVCNLVL